jgi:hypothetical protein
MRFEDHEVGADAIGHPCELDRGVTDRDVHKDARPLVLNEQGAQPLERPLRILDLVAHAEVLGMPRPDEPMRERLWAYHVYDVNLGLVDRPNEVAGLRQQVFTGVAHVDSDNDDDTAGLRCLGCSVHWEELLVRDEAAPGMGRAYFAHQTTGVGVSEGAAFVPFPNSPSALTPQHQTVPVDRRVQVLLAPTAKATTLVRLETATGMDEALFVPLPSAPAPQHATVPVPDEPMEQAPV